MRHTIARGLRKVARMIDKDSSANAGKACGNLNADPDGQKFIEWLRFANAGMLVSGNLPLFEFAIANLPSEAPIVEIGAFCGLSTNVISHYKRRHRKQNKLFSSDKWEFENANTDKIPGSNILFSDYRRFVVESFIRNVKMFSGDELPFAIEAISDDFFSAWRANQELSDVIGRPIKLGGLISFCYIDGNHSYEYAKRDFDNCNEFLEPGGFILFDDSADGSPWEVTRVIEEVKRLGNYEVVQHNPNYLFQKTK